MRFVPQPVFRTVGAAFRMCFALVVALVVALMVCVIAAISAWELGMRFDGIPFRLVTYFLAGVVVINVASQLVLWGMPHQDR